MHWILQSGFEYENGWDDLIEVLERDKIPYSVHKVVPFIGKLIPEPELDTDRVFCVGSYSMRHTAKKNGWKPGVVDLADEINFRNFYYNHAWYQEYDDGVRYEQSATHNWNLLNSDAYITTIKEGWNEEEFLNEDELFIRPLDDTKSFAGKVFSKEEFNKWRDDILKAEAEDVFNNRLFSDTEIIFATPKEILREYRFWIVNDMIVASSVYKTGNRVAYSQIPSGAPVFKYVYELTCPASDKYWQPADAYVLDIAEGFDDNFSVIEMNTINSAGFYAGDVFSIVRNLEAYYNAT